MDTGPNHTTYIGTTGQKPQNKGGINGLDNSTPDNQNTITVDGIPITIPPRQTGASMQTEELAQTAAPRQAEGSTQTEELAQPAAPRQAGGSTQPAAPRQAEGSTQTAAPRQAGAPRQPGGIGDTKKPIQEDGQRNVPEHLKYWKAEEAKAKADKAAKGGTKRGSSGRDTHNYVLPGGKPACVTSKKATLSNDNREKQRDNSQG